MCKINLSRMKAVSLALLFLLGLSSLITARPCLGDSMPLPYGAEIIPVSPVSSPIISIDPAQANPFGFGPAAGGGSTMALSVGISQIAEPADLYIGFQADILGKEIFLIGSSSFSPMSSGLVKWRSGTYGNISTPVMPEIPLPQGSYTFYMLMTPAGRIDSMRIWITSLVIEDSPTPGQVSSMEREIRQNLDLVFGVSSVFSGGLTEITAIFSDKNVINTSPAKLDLNSLLSGNPITITASFGSGYTMASGSVISGDAKIMISNIIFNNSGIGADFSARFNDIRKDGASFINGGISGSLLLSEDASERTVISGNIGVDNLSISGMQLSGQINITGTLGELNLSSLDKTSGTIRVSLSNFIIGTYTVNSGYVDIELGGSGISLVTNLQTSRGPVEFTALLTSLPNNAMVLNTGSPGSLGPYTMTMNGVTLDQNTCPNYPAGGSIEFFDPGTGKTGIVSFTSACDGSYGYSER